MASYSDSPTPSSLPSLQDYCLRSVVGRLEEYNPQSLSLLPTGLRRQLLVRLPVADIIKVENDPLFMEGISLNSIWRGIFDSRMKPKNVLLFRKVLGKHKSAREFYLHEVAMNILTNDRGQWCFSLPDLSECTSNSDLVAYMLFGTRVISEDEVDILPQYFSKHISMGMTWSVPHRYCDFATSLNCPEHMVKVFVDLFHWYPKRIEFCEQDVIASFNDKPMLGSFLSHVTTVSLNNRVYNNYEFAESTEPVWRAIALSGSSNLTDVTLSACVTNLGCFIQVMLNCLYSVGSIEDDHRISGLKRIEFLGNIAGSRPHDSEHDGFVSSYINDSIPFLHFQDDLEMLTVVELSDIDKTEDCDDENYGRYISTFGNFEQFYNYLPYFICKPSFKKLRLERFHIPINSVKSMISTFLSTPTDHDQKIELLSYDVVTQCTDIFSEKFPLINQRADDPCVSGEYKSLQVSNCPLLPLQWLYEYPRLKLKCLEILYHELNMQDIDYLKVFPESAIDTLVCRLSYLGYSNESKIAIRQFPFHLLYEMIIDCMIDRDNSIISTFTDVLRQPARVASMKQMLLENFSCSAVDIKPIFDALFSLPKVQLAEFTLIVYALKDLNQEDILDSWKANSRGQKLQELHVVLKQYFLYQEGQRISMPQKLIELNEIACKCIIRRV